MRIRLGKLSPDVNEDEILSSSVPDDKISEFMEVLVSNPLNLLNGADNDGVNAKIIHQWIEVNNLSLHVWETDFWVLLATDHCLEYCKDRFKGAIYSRIRQNKGPKRQALSRLYWGADAVKIRIEDCSVKDRWSGILSDTNLGTEDSYRFCNVLFDLQDTYEATVGGREIGRDKRMLVAILNGIETFNSDAVKNSTKGVSGEHVKRLAKHLVFLLSGRSLSALEWNRLRYIIDHALKKIDHELRSDKKNKNKMDSSEVKGHGFIINSAESKDPKNVENVLRSVKKPTFIIRKKDE